jgi:polysaccharide export outer membrane protein
MKQLFTLCMIAALSGCGTAYISSSIQNDGTSNVRVIPITAQSVLTANRSNYVPQQLPAAFSTNAGLGNGLRVAGALPDLVFSPESRPAGLEMRLPPVVSTHPYTIGVGDVLLLATPQPQNTQEALSGLLAAQNRRQGYTVQDDGGIAIPGIGRVQLLGLTLEEAENEVFERLVERQVDPSFSLEVSEFNSRRVSIGGAVQSPGVARITLTPLYLDEALAQAGGVNVSAREFATVRIYRGGTLYQIPVSELFSNDSLRRIRLVEGDSVFVDTAFDLERAQGYFEQQIIVRELQRNARLLALRELESEVSLRRFALTESRENFESRLQYGAVARDYVYVVGEVNGQGRFALPFERVAVLADPLFENGGLSEGTGNPSQIYVLRGSGDPMDPASITALHLDARNAANFLLATRLELRPNDVIFVAEQPVTRWNRVIQQIVPSVITSSIAAASG